MEDKADAGRPPAGNEASGGVHIYHLSGPGWRPRLHPGSQSLGTPDVYDSQGNAVEDDLSENLVKNGFSVRPVVVNETFSAHDMIFDRLKAKSLLPQLGSLFREVVLRRDNLTSHQGAPASAHFRPPQRVTLNEVKLAAYVKELADPSVPLRKLARSVPHGYRGERMLDMLWNGGNLTPAMAAIKAAQTGHSAQIAPRSVTVDRAVWFVRVVGSSELVSEKNLSGRGRAWLTFRRMQTSSRARQSSANSYTIEWTTVMMGWLRRQLVELNVVHSSIATTPTTPSSPSAMGNRANAYATAKAGFPPSAHPDASYSLLLEDDFCNRWVSKWQYSIMLLRGLCHQHLVEPQVLVKTTLDMVRTANVVQISFLLALFEELIESVFSNAGIVHYALDILCGKMTDFASSMENGRFGASSKKEMESIFIHIAAKKPDALVNPSRWTKHGDLMRRLMDTNLSRETALLVACRNERLLNALLSERIDSGPTSVSDEHRIDIAILDRLGVETDLQDTFTRFFRPGKQNISEKLRTILLWSTTTWRSGSYRAFAGAKMIHLFSQSRNAKPGRGGKTPILVGRIDLDTFLLKWISEVELAIQKSSTERLNLTAIQSVDIELLIVMVGEIIRLGSFSYSKYLQRLTARGLTATSLREDKGDSMDFLHAKVMRSVPLLSASASLEHQRRVAIYGNRSKESWEEAMQRRAWKEVASAFPCSQAALDPTQSVTISWNDEERLRHFWSSSRFVQTRVIQAHVMAYFRKAHHLDSLPAQTFVQLCRFLSQTDDYVSLCEVILAVLENPQPTEKSLSLLSAARDVAMEHRMVWVAMGLPLLERLDLSSLPVCEVEKRNRGSPIHANEEVMKRLHESAIKYVQGNQVEASQILDQAVPTLYFADAATVLHAGLRVLAETDIETDTVGAVVEWMKLVPAAVEVPWDDAWQRALVDSLDAVLDTNSKATCRLVMQLVLSDLVPAGDLLRNFALPCLEQACLVRATTPGCPLQTAVDVVGGLLLAFVEPSEPTSLAKLRSIRSTLIVSTTMRDVVRVISCLASLEDDMAAVGPLRQSICQEPLIQAYFQPELLELAKIVRERVTGKALHGVLVDLLPGRRSLLQGNPMELDHQAIFGEGHEWLTQQRVFELSVIVQRLENVESGQQNRSQSRIETIAQLSALHWFSPATIEQYGLPLLTEARSHKFAATIIDELFRRLHGHLQAEGLQQAGLGTSGLLDVQCGLHLVQKQEKQALPTSSVATTVLASISDWLETAADKWQEGHEEQLGLRLATLCLFLRFENGWNAQSKALASPLIVALFRLAIQLSCQSEVVRGAVVDQVLDVGAYLLQEMPSDVHQSVQLHADSISALVQEAMPADETASRILFLFNRGRRIDASRLILASSAASVFLHGQVLPVVEKPWELHSNVEALEHYLDQGPDHKPSEVDFLPLINNGPLSLDVFGAKSSRDRLPIPGVKIDSEISYGPHWAGEPLYARDIRKGLLDLETDKEVKGRGKSLARVAGTYGADKGDEDKAGVTATPGKPAKKRQERERTWTSTSTASHDGGARKKPKKR